MRGVNVPAGSSWVWEDIQLECRSRCSTMIVSVWGAAGCHNLNQIGESRPELSDCTFEVLALRFLSSLPSAPWMEQLRTSTVLTRKQIESRIFCWMFKCVQICVWKSCAWKSCLQETGCVQGCVWKNCVYKRCVFKVVCERCVWKRSVWKFVCSRRCHQAPRLPRKTKVDVAKCHAYPAKRRLMSPSARPATRSAAESQATNGDQAPTAPPDPAQRHKRHACPAKRRLMSPSATLATQNEGWCHQVPRPLHPCQPFPILQQFCQAGWTVLETFEVPRWPMMEDTAS